MSSHKRILIITPFYLPGNKAGGPIRSLANMVDRLGEVFHFQVITDDREFQGTKPYGDVTIDEWNSVGKASVFYRDVRRPKFSFYKKMLSQLSYDVLYLNSFFHREFTVIPLLLKRLGLLPDKPVVLAPRGELTPGALDQKKLKKYLYLYAVRSLGLYHSIHWHAASDQEADHIRYWFGDQATVSVAENLPERLDGSFGKLKKNDGKLRIVFVSRISTKKNIIGALKILQKVSVGVQYDIYGPIEDRSYWKKCEKLIAGLPSHIRVSYKGELPHQQVLATMAAYDLFFMPTLGENYGHVIIEALSAGCPVLISDQTPWNDLQEKGAGWSYPLDRPEEFVRQIETIASADEQTYSRWIKNAETYARSYSEQDCHVEETKKMFIAYT